MRKYFLIGLFVYSPVWATCILEQTSGADQYVNIVLYQDSNGAAPGDLHTGETLEDSEILLSKNGAALAVKEVDANCTEDATLSGYYRCILGQTDLATAGWLQIVPNNANSLQVPTNCMVMPTQEYDSLYGTDELQVHVVEYTASVITATAIATDAIGADEIAASAIGADEIAANAIGASEIATAAITNDELASDGSEFTESGGTGDQLTAINLPNQTMDITGSITGNLSGSVGSVTGAVGSVTAGVTLANGAVTDASLAGGLEIVFETDLATNYDTTSDTWTVDLDNADGTLDASEVGLWHILDTGTASAVAAGSITLDGTPGFSADEMNGNGVVVLTATTGAGQCRRITDFGVAANRADISENWSTTPTGTVTYAVIPGAVCAALAVVSDTTTAIQVGPDGLVLADLREYNNTDISEDTAGYPTVTIKDGTGTGEINTLSGAVVNVDTVDSVTALAANAIGAGDIADDGIEAGDFATGAIDADAIATSALTTLELDYCGTGISFIVQNNAANSTSQVCTDLSDADFGDDQFGGSSIPKRAVVFMTGNAEGLAATIQSFDTTAGACEDLLTFTDIGTEPAQDVIGCIH